MTYTYQTLDALLTGRCKERRKLANNTYAVRGDTFDGEPLIHVRLHETNVLTFYADGTVAYDSGGWRTVTTKDRMNNYGPALIFSERGRWYARIHNSGPVYVFEDGMTVGPRGGVTGARRRATDTEPGDKIIKARARTLSNALVDAAPFSSEDDAFGFPALVLRALSHAHAGPVWWWGFFDDRKWLDTFSLRENGGTGRSLNGHAARFVYRELIRGAGLQA